ncbi:MAG: substrate-binding domain-containing protein [Candidatus Hydrogenedentes bacterium]|nr:substrate-binding domain-containing protein [Candidatus Hydrogenedentota bacterium]
MRTFLSLAIALVFAGMLASCGGSGGEKQKTIGASFLTQTHVFYQDMIKAIEEEAAKQGFNLRIQFAEFDSRRQNDQIETLLAQNVDALLVAPADSSAVGSIIAQANAQGVPVFTVDIAAQDAEVVSHIASDNYAGGVMLAEYLAKQLDGKGTIAIIDHPTVESVQQRTKGFLETLQKYPEMQVVARPPGEGQRDKALRVAQDVVQAHPDLDAIFAINDDSALGALAAVEAAGKQNDIIIVGFDGTPEARTAIQEGKALKADAVQYPDQIGKKAIDIIATYLQGGKVPEMVPVEVGLIDVESLNQEPAQ